MQRRTLLTRIIACLAAVKLLRVLFTSKLQAQTPNVPPIHVELSYWHKVQYQVAYGDERMHYGFIW